MKSCTIRRRFWTAEAAGAAVTVDLEPGFGTPQACLIFYTENSLPVAIGDTTLASRNIGIGMVGPADSRVSSTLIYRTCTGTMTDNVSPASVRRQDSNSRYIVAQNAGGTIFWQFATASFSADKATFTPSASTPQTNGHIEAIMTFFTGTGFSVGIGNSSFSPTAGGTRVFSGLSWQPDVVFVASTINVLNAGSTDDFRFSFGCATRSPLKQKGIYLHQENSAAGATALMGAVSSSTIMIPYSTVAGATVNTHTISNINATGWTFTSSDAAGGSNGSYIYMAMSTGNPADFALVDILTPAASGDQFTGLGSSGFIPKTVLGAQTNCPTDNTREQQRPNADSISLFSGNRGGQTLYWNGTGTISTSTGSSVITGTNTEFYRFAPGDTIYSGFGITLGIVSTVESKTSMTMQSNVLSTLSNISYEYANLGQYSIGMGTSTGGNPMNVFSFNSRTLLNIYQGFNNIQARAQEVGRLTDFDSRPGFNLNFTLVSGTPKRGWALAIADENKRRRRGSGS
jgi:hypothetical protein